jgi:hypothetical protein
MSETGFFDFRVGFVRRISPVDSLAEATGLPELASFVAIPGVDPRGSTAILADGFVCAVFHAPIRYPGRSARDDYCMTSCTR